MMLDRAPFISPEATNRDECQDGHDLRRHRSAVGDPFVTADMVRQRVWCGSEWTKERVEKRMCANEQLGFLVKQHGYRSTNISKKRGLSDAPRCRILAAISSTYHFRATSRCVEMKEEVSAVSGKSTLCAGFDCPTRCFSKKHPFANCFKGRIRSCSSMDCVNRRARCTRWKSNALENEHVEVAEKATWVDRYLGGREKECVQQTERRHSLIVDPLGLQVHSSPVRASASRVWRFAAPFGLDPCGTQSGCVDFLMPLSGDWQRAGRVPTMLATHSVVAILLLACFSNWLSTVCWRIFVE